METKQAGHFVSHISEWVVTPEFVQTNQSLVAEFQPWFCGCYRLLNQTNMIVRVKDVLNKCPLSEDQYLNFELKVNLLRTKNNK